MVTSFTTHAMDRNRIYQTNDEVLQENSWRGVWCLFSQIFHQLFQSSSSTTSTTIILWTESKSYQTGNLITVKFVLEANNGKPLNEHYNKARVSLIRKNDGKEREVISSKLVDVVDGQIMHEVFKTSREGKYQFILNYGPIGKETDESEEFSVTTKKSSEPTNESVSSEPTYKRTARPECGESYIFRPGFPDRICLPCTTMTDAMRDRARTSLVCV